MFLLAALQFRIGVAHPWRRMNCLVKRAVTSCTAFAQKGEKFGTSQDCPSPMSSTAQGVPVPDKRYPQIGIAISVRRPS